MMTNRWLLTTTLILAVCATAMGSGNTNLDTNPLGGSAGSSQPLCYSHWQNVGPFSVTHNYTDIGTGLQDPEDIGAINEVWLDSTGIAYVGSVNGGVWKSSAAVSTPVAFNGPHWTPLTDQMDCNSIASVSGSSTDNNVVAAGCGFVSNSYSRGGEPKGVMLTSDGGSTWSMTNFPKGFAVTSLLVSGNGSTTNILVAAKLPPSGYLSGSTGSPVDPYGVGTNVGGIWLSTDAGATFTQTYNTLPVGKLIRDKTTSTTLYAVAFAVYSAGSYGPSALVSTDSGATWNPLANRPAITDKCASQDTISGVTFAASASRLYLGYYTTTSAGGADCYAMYYSADLAASSWTAIANIPSIGNQGSSNFAMFAYPGDSNTIFVSGTGSKVWRVDTTAGVWTDIADANGVTGATASLTAPHADARNFAWDYTTGSLLRCDDGGLYSRSSPMNATGDWTSKAGDLSITEAYQAAYDPVSGAVILGAQDNSLMVSQFDGTEKTSGVWSFLLTGDGPGVGVDTSTSPASFYGNDQNLAGWFKVPVNANSAFGGVNNVVQGFTGTIGGCNPGDSTATCFDFVTMTAANRINPSDVLICTLGSTCYKNTFPGTSTMLEFNGTALGVSTPMAYIYGGVKNNVTNAEVVLAIGQNMVWSRDINTCASTACIHSYSTAPCTSCLPGSMVNTAVPWKTTVTNFRSVAQHPTDYYINAIIDDSGHIWLTLDFGQTWTDIALPANSNLLSTSGHTTVDTMNTLSAIFVNTPVNGVYPLIVGTTYGSFVTFTAPAANANYTFVKLGANQPKTFVSSYTYSPANDVLVMSTFGRGIWTLQKASEILALAAAGSDTTTINSGCKVPLYPNVPNAYGYISSGVLPSPIGFPGGSSSSSTGASASGSSSSSTGAAASGSSSSSTGTVATSSSSTATSTGNVTTSSSSAGSSSSGTVASGSSSSTGTTTSASSSSTAATITTIGSSTGTSNVNGTSSSTGIDYNSSAFSNASSGILILVGTCILALLTIRAF